MRIACPSCAAEYDVPESRVKPGKMVRCARCGGEWMAADDLADDVAEPDPGPTLAEAYPEPSAEPVVSAPAMTAMDRLPASRSVPPSQSGLIGAWVLTAVVLTGAATGVIVWREAIVRIWPPSSRILAPADHPMPQPAQTAGNGAK